MFKSGILTIMQFVHLHKQKGFFEPAVELNLPRSTPFISFLALSDE